MEKTVTTGGIARPATGKSSAGTAATAGRWPVTHLLLMAFAAGLTSGIIVLIHRLSPRTLVSAHGLLHSAVAGRFASGDVQQLPPANPFYAGEPLPYYWVFHYIGGTLSRLFDIHPLIAFEIMIVAGVWLIWFSAAVLGRRMYGSALPGLATGFLAFAGANAIGPWLFASRVALGADDLPADSASYLWGIAHPIVGRLGLEDPFSLYQPLIFFYFNITSRPVALALVFATATVLYIWLRSGGTGALIGLTLLTAAATAMSPLIGGAAAGALVCGLVAAWLLRRVGAVDGETETWPERYLPAAAAMVLGVVLAAPTVYHLVGLGGGIRFAPSPSAVIGVGSGAFVLAAMAAVALLRTTGPQRRFLVVLSVAAAILLLANMVLVLPAGNHTNFFHAAAVLLPIVAVSAVVPAGRSAGRIRRHAAWGLLLFVPAPAIIVYGFHDRPPIPLELDGAVMERTPADAPLAQLYAWMSEETEANAVFVTDPRPPIVTAVGNMPELPALTGRDLFTAHASSYMVTPYADAADRHNTALRLLEGEPLESSQAALIARLGRPLYIVSGRADEPALLEALQSRYGQPRFRSAELAVFRFVE